MALYARHTYLSQGVGDASHTPGNATRFSVPGGGHLPGFAHTQQIQSSSWNTAARPKDKLA
jgi:hypothetical protein